VHIGPPKLDVLVFGKKKKKESDVRSKKRSAVRVATASCLKREHSGEAKGRSGRGGRGGRTAADFERSLGGVWGKKAEKVSMRYGKTPTWHCPLGYESRKNSSVRWSGEEEGPPSEDQSRSGTARSRTQGRAVVNKLGLHAGCRNEKRGGMGPECQKLGKR